MFFPCLSCQITKIKLPSILEHTLLTYNVMVGELSEVSKKYPAVTFSICDYPFGKQIAFAPNCEQETPATALPI